MIISETNSEIKLDLELTIEATIDYCKKHNYSFACWKSPNNESVTLLLDFEGAQLLEKLTLENSKTGFVISAFEKKHKSWFIKNDLTIEWKEDSDAEIKNEARAEKYLDFVRSYKRIDNSKLSLVTEKDSNSSHYLSLVESTISAIKQGRFSKVVPSRSKNIEYSGHLDLGKKFKSLCSQYENAFVSIHYTANTGLWVGATPEVLLETTGQTFKTVSLAGTQAFDKNQSLADVAWTQKEIEEQALVSRYIIDCFKKIRLRDFIEKGPKTVKAGNLIHLKTTYEVDMQATNFEELGTTMLHLLHPTSAVCGMPLVESLEFILEREGYDRELYSGYLGPVAFNNNTTLYVNLRCMKVEEQQLKLYAGAGVTEDSNPVKEWEETELKMNTLLNIISEH